MASLTRLLPASAQEREKLLVTVTLAVAFGFAASLALMYFGGTWPVDARGRPDAQDFIAFWTAGKLALHGSVLATYDPGLQHAAEVAIVGHPFNGALGWSYPPAFFFVATFLALLPYAPSFILWIAATYLAHGAVTGAIARNWTMFALACAAPWSLAVLLTGQNGFFTATLAGIAFLNIEKRPALGGLFLGLLSYKPQLGILVPLALAAGGYWRAFGWAAFFACASNLLAASIFGFETLPAFVHAVSATAQTHLVKDGAGWWFKLQSAYGMVRDLGGSSRLAWLAQMPTTCAVALTVTWFWRQPISYAAKAALLAAAMPLATPYVFTYDLPILAVSVAFLLRDGPLDEFDWVLLAATVPCVFAMVWVPLPCAFLANLAVGALALRRCYGALPRSRMSPSWVTEATSLPSSE